MREGNKGYPIWFKPPGRSMVAQVTENFNGGYRRNVSQSTVHHTLLCMGLRSRRAVRVPMMTPVHRCKRLQWAREHRNWTLEQWKKVAWSDESRFLLDHVDGRVRVCRLPGEVMARGCTGGGSVMLWAMFCWETLGPAIHVDVNLTRVTYLNIVADQVHPFMAKVFLEGSGLFQQDNVPCHTAHIVWECFEEHDEVFMVLPWPPNSPDLNPIEHLWDVLVRQVQSTAAPPLNLQDLKDLLLMFWYQTPQDPSGVL
uniref:Transposable element Tc1 transposase n=1 Tax=Eptatretus burgeri TaxID=7764 RepID=A0A8C4Q1N8_EPTBU